VSLVNLTHSEAVQCLKSSSNQSRRVLHVLQVGQPSRSAALGTVNFRPMWTYWLSLPSYVARIIQLSQNQSLGLCCCLS